MKYIVNSIPHDRQRYETVGDWIECRGHLRHVRVSEMDNEDYAFLVGIHEQIEAWLCIKRGISQESVDKFDIAFEQHRDLGDENEPGDDPAAPYRCEHQFATKVERMLATELGIDWDIYDHTVMGLSK